MNINKTKFNDFNEYGTTLITRILIILQCQLLSMKFNHLIDIPEKENFLNLTYIFHNSLSLR
jgi:hypothetical protein